MTQIVCFARFRRTSTVRNHASLRISNNTASQKAVFPGAYRLKTARSKKLPLAQDHHQIVVIYCEEEENERVRDV